ncbi:MAG: RidA family protein [Bacteroidaceae bacterium]|jgi:2-iminobutanoate/2-iminopropanoate deaminase|nr:RidA family protein [Bacteroidaceae bacterium]
MRKTIATAKAPAAIGPYSQGVDLNGTVYVSGQIPVNPADGTIPAGIELQTRQAMDNIGAILNEAGLSYNDIVKTTVLLADLADFAAMNAVYAEYFPQDKPARVCCQVAALPKGALVEIDAIAGK